MFQCPPTWPCHRLPRVGALLMRLNALADPVMLTYHGLVQFEHPSKRLSAHALCTAKCRAHMSRRCLLARPPGRSPLSRSLSDRRNCAERAITSPLPAVGLALAARHSHITNTRHPAVARALTARRSRERFPSIFACQNSGRVAGILHSGAAVTMPEAAMHEDDRAPRWKHQIGTPGQVFAVQPETKSESMEAPAQE